MRLVGDDQKFDRLLDAARAYWAGSRSSRAGGDQCVVTEALHQDIRVVVRNLLMANALCDLLPARLVVLTGTDQEWSEALWEQYDIERARGLAEAFGAAEVVNVHDLVDRHLAGGGESAAPEGIDAAERATLVRLARVPRLPETEDEWYRARRARTRAFSAVYERLFADLPAAALVTSHVDYDQWGLAVDAAMRREIPVVHVQSTGCMKAYALFPERRKGLRTFREELTGLIAEHFHEHVWPHRSAIKANAELVASRAKGNLGRPSWWRAGGTSQFELQSETERRQLRQLGCQRFGLDPDRPMFAVFNHAISDALGTNREVFGDLAQWFEETADFAARQDSVNWLFLDHPSQALYDTTGHFGAVTARHAGRRHMAFMPSLALSKNMLWSMTDLGVTVRGSVSNELPAFGIPVIQAGWSEWSGCGLSYVAENRDDYWRLLGEAIARHAKGASMVTEEQRERARLWLWLYRSGADVPSPLLPHWEMGEGDTYAHALTIAMRHVERDGDPFHCAVRRMWERREPVLTRLDFRHTAGIDRALGTPIRAVTDAPPAMRTATGFDTAVPPVQVPVEISSGRAAELQAADHFRRGVQIVGRFERSGLVGLKVAEAGHAVRVNVTLSVDELSAQDWHLKQETGVDDKALPRLIQVRAQGRLRQCLLLESGGAVKKGTVVFDLMPDELPADGLLCIEVLDVTEGSGVPETLRGAVAGSVMDDGVAGLRIDRVRLQEIPDDDVSDPALATLDASRCERASLISSGGLVNLKGRGSHSLSTGMFVVNPVPQGVFGSGGDLTIRLGQKTGTPACREPRTWPRRMAWHRGRRERRTAGAPNVGPVLSIHSGDEVPVAHSKAGDSTELRLRAPAESPLLVTVAPAQGAQPTLISTDWCP
ncbi:hypothetical protein ACQEVF_15405 [Nonomuraea polychroma]|uniref:hypothetical protein n=1 Tax=Nonomuraea polychroma TaxID=46176 RepID=UPI003D8F1E90